jgi:hypothetical protein
LAASNNGPAFRTSRRDGAGCDQQLLAPLPLAAAEAADLRKVNRHLLRLDVAAFSVYRGRAAKTVLTIETRL